MKTINRKMPGIVPPAPKSEIDGKLTDLSSKTVPELLELRERQRKLLSNKVFISKLADKGEKLQQLHEKIERELKAKEEEDQACRMLDNLRLNGVDKQSIQSVEWEGRVNSKRDAYLDSDDDSDPEDVLHILSQTTAQDKKLVVLKPETPLITPRDLEEIGEVPHIKYIVNKTEHNVEKPKTGQYKPYKTTKTDVHDPEKEIHRKRDKHWEVTAATPPPSIHGPAKILSIEESLKLQKEHNHHLKEIEAQNAASKLAARIGIKISEMPDDTTVFGKYRDVQTDSDVSDPEGSDKEVHDEEPEKGGVVFTVMK